MAARQHDSLTYIKDVCRANLLEKFHESLVSSVIINLTKNGNKYTGECEGDTLDEGTLAEMNKIVQDTLKTYDVIILLDVHGEIYPKQYGDVITCDIQEFEGDCVTILQAASCGSPNYADGKWYNYAREQCTEMLTFIGPIRNMADSLQHEFRKDKQKDLKNPHSGIHAAMEKDGMDSEWVKAFIDAPGWEIRSQKMFSERDYILDKIYPLSMVVVYSELSSDLTAIESNTNLKKLFPRGIFTRSELLHFLYVRGARNPLIIENSCGGVCTRSARKARAVARELKKVGLSGGKRTKRTKRTRNKTKRAKHFKHSFGH